MRTIFATFVWETLVRGRWLLPLGFLSCNLLSVILYATCVGRGIAITKEPEFVVFHLVASQMNMGGFGVCLFCVQGKAQRLFTLPITNRTIAAYTLLVAMMLTFAESVLSAMLINALYGAGWPLWGPALAGAVGVAAIYAAMWIADRSLWLIFNLTVVGSLGGIWYRLRYEPLVRLNVDALFSGNERLRFWDAVSVAEFLTMSAAALVAYGVAVIGLGWRRRGEDALSVGFIAWATRWLDPPLEVGPPFLSPLEAQHWFERRQKASIIPAIVAIGMVFYLMAWLIFDRDPRRLFSGLYVAGGWGLIVVGFLGGMICGNAGSGDAGDGDAAADMGHFLGTRPLTSKGMANIFLKVAFRGVATGWLMWVVAVMLLHLLLLPSGDSITNDLWSEPNVLWLSLLGSWMAAGVGMTFLMMGRPRALMFASFSVIACMTAWLMGITFFVPAEAKPTVEDWLCKIVGAAGIAITAMAFGLAWRRQLLSSAIALAGVALWSLAAALAIWMAYQTNYWSAPITSILLATGIASLVAAPLATAPLALAWNRVR